MKYLVDELLIVINNGFYLFIFPIKVINLIQSFKYEMIKDINILFHKIKISLKIRTIFKGGRKSIIKFEFQFKQI